MRPRQSHARLAPPFFNPARAYDSATDSRSNTLPPRAALAQLEPDLRKTILNAVEAQQTTPEPQAVEVNGTPQDPIAKLSPRRLEVLQLVARGLTNPEIASVLGISANTVKTHLASILEILDLTNRTEAAMALHDFETSRP